MLKIQNDESIYSLIYRTHIVNGVLNFSNILDKKGRWDGSPSILKSTLSFYQPVQDSLFYELLKKINFFSNERDLFSLSQMGVSELRYFFNDEPSYSPIRNSYPIRYCQSCIFEHIKKLGFFYFKNSWLKETECETHNEILVQINAATSLGSLKKLSKIHQVRLTLQKGSNGTKKKKNTQSKRDHVAPCMAVAMYQHLSYRVGYFPAKAYQYKAYQNNVMSHDLLRQPHILQHVFETIKKERHYSYFEVMKFAELHTFYVGWVNKRSISISVYKLKPSNCSNCQYFSCSANKTIIYANVYYPQLTKCEYNNELLLKHVTTTDCFTNENKRVAIQALTLDSKLRLIKTLKIGSRYHEPYFMQY